MVFVDDASRDGTLAELRGLMAELPELRVLSHGSNAGQSRAVRTGVLAARAPIVVTLDGDGQNPPADAPRLAGAGRGLVGMRERARMYGGTVEAGPLPGCDGSGWRVAVVLTDTEEAR